MPDSTTENLSKNGQILKEPSDKLIDLLKSYLFLTTKQMTCLGLNAYEKAALDRIDNLRRQAKINRTTFLQSIAALHKMPQDGSPDRQDPSSHNSQIQAILDYVYGQALDDYLDIMHRYGPHDGFTYVVHLNLPANPSANDLEKAIGFLKAVRDAILSNSHLDIGVLKEGVVDKGGDDPRIPYPVVRDDVHSCYQIVGQAWGFLKNQLPDAILKKPHTLVISYPNMKDLGGDLPNFQHLHILTMWIEHLNGFLLKEGEGGDSLHQSIEQLQTTSEADLRKVLEASIKDTPAFIHPKSQTQTDLIDIAKKIGPPILTAKEKQVLVIKKEYEDYKEAYALATQKKKGLQGLLQKIRIALKKEVDPASLICMKEEEFIEERLKELVVEEEPSIPPPVGEPNPEIPQVEEPIQQLQVQYINPEIGLRIYLSS